MREQHYYKPNFLEEHLRPDAQSDRLPHSFECELVWLAFALTARGGGGADGWRVWLWRAGHMFEKDQKKRWEEIQRKLRQGNCTST